MRRGRTSVDKMVFGKWYRLIRRKARERPLHIGCVTMMLLTVLSIQGCNRDAIHCQHAFDLSPAELLHQNDYVATATLLSVDTVAYFGDRQGTTADMGEYLVERIFRTDERIKVPSEDTVLFVWYLAAVNRSTRYSGSIFCNVGSSGLIYGRRFESPDDILRVVTTRINGTFEAFLDSLSRGLWDRENPRLFDDGFVLADSIMHNESLKERLRASMTRGPVLYATDPWCGTAQSFGKGVLHYCEPGVKTGIATRKTAKNYLKELKKLAGSEQPK